MTQSAGDSSPMVLNCLQPPYPTDLFAIRNLDTATLDVKIHGELPDQTDVLIGSYFAGAVRVPGPGVGAWQTLSSPCQRVFKQSTVFYIGKHMFHVLFPDASVTEDNVAVSTMAQSTVMPQSSTSLPLAPPPLPVPTSMPAPSLQQPHHIQPNQPLHSAANAASTTSVMSQPLARSSSHVRLTAGTESRDGDADESKLLSKNRALRRSGSVQQKTPAANERPLTVPQAPRAQSSHSHSSQKKRAEESFAEALADDEVDENSEAYDTMDDAKSRDLAAEFSNDGPKPLDPALLGVGPRWDEDRAERFVEPRDDEKRDEKRDDEARDEQRDEEREEDQDIAVSALPPFTRTSPPAAIAQPRRASHVSLVAPPVAAEEQPVPVDAAVAAPPVAAPMQREVRQAAIAGNKRGAPPTSDRKVKARKSSAVAQRQQHQQEKQLRNRRGGSASAGKLFRSMNAIIVRASQKPQSIDENDNEEGNNMKRKASSSKPEPRKSDAEASKVSKAVPTKRPRVVAFTAAVVTATPDINQQRKMPRAPKKNLSAATAATNDPRETFSLVQQTKLPSMRETQSLVSNVRILPTQASRRAGSRVSTISLGRLVTQATVPAADDSPSASSQRSGSKSVRRALPLDAKSK